MRAPCAAAMALFIGAASGQPASGAQHWVCSNGKANVCIAQGSMPASCIPACQKGSYVTEVDGVPVAPPREPPAAVWPSFQSALGHRIVTSAPRQIGPRAHEVTLSDGSKWACFGDCDEFFAAVKKSMTGFE